MYIYRHWMFSVLRSPDATSVQWASNTFASASMLKETLPRKSTIRRTGHVLEPIMTCSSQHGVPVGMSQRVILIVRFVSTALACTVSKAARALTYEATPRIMQDG